MNPQDITNRFTYHPPKPGQPENGNWSDPTILIGDKVTYFDRDGKGHHGWCSHIWPSVININYGTGLTATSIPLKTQGMTGSYYVHGHVAQSEKVADQSISCDKSGQAAEPEHAGFTNACPDAAAE